MCVCVYEYIYRVYICIRVCLQTCIPMYIYIYISTCATHTRHFAIAALCTTRSPFRRMCACVRSHAYKHIYVCTYTYIYSMRARCSSTAVLCTPRSLSSVSSIRYILSKVAPHTYTLSPAHQNIDIYGCTLMCTNKPTNIYKRPFSAPSSIYTFSKVASFTCTSKHECIYGYIHYVCRSPYTYIF